MNKTTNLLSIIAFCCTSTMLAQNKEQTLKLNTSKNEGEKISLSLQTSTKGVTIDWGDGHPQTYKGNGSLLDIQGEVKGKTITIIGDKNFNTIICENQSITKIDLSEMPFLRSIYCSGNDITTADFTSTPKIVDIDLSHNKLRSIKISNQENIELEYLNLADNQLRAVGTYGIFKLTMPSLQHINIAKNLFTAAFISGLSNLDSFIVSENRISMLDLRKTGLLSTLVAYDNKIRKINIDEQNNRMTNMQQCLIDNNRITEFNCNYMNKLKDLSISHNQLIKLQIPRKILNSYNCSHNALSFNSMPVKDMQPEKEQLCCFPQNDIDLSPLLENKHLQHNNYYIPLCPSYNDRKTKKYCLDADFIRRDGNNHGTCKVTWYGGNKEGNEKKLQEADYKHQNLDYVVTYGKTAFLTPHLYVYATITNEKNYPGKILKTSMFTVGEENIIDAIDSPVNKTTNIIYNLQGQRVKQTHPRHIYIINGKKTFIK